MKKFVITVKKNYCTVKKYCTVRDHCNYTREYGSAAHSTSNLKYSVPKNISIVFHNGSNYDHHFIIKKIEEELF